MITLLLLLPLVAAAAAGPKDIVCDRQAVLESDDSTDIICRFLVGRKYTLYEIRVLDSNGVVVMETWTEYGWTKETDYVHNGTIGDNFSLELVWKEYFFFVDERKLVEQVEEFYKDSYRNAGYVDAGYLVRLRLRGMEAGQYSVQYRLRDRQYYDTQFKTAKVEVMGKGAHQDTYVNAWYTNLSVDKQGYVDGAGYNKDIVQRILYHCVGFRGRVEVRVELDGPDEWLTEVARPQVESSQNGVHEVYGMLKYVTFQQGLKAGSITCSAGNDRSSTDLKSSITFRRFYSEGDSFNQTIMILILMLTCLCILGVLLIAASIVACKRACRTACC